MGQNLKLISVFKSARDKLDFLGFIRNASARARLLGITAATVAVSRHDAWTVRCFCCFSIFANLVSAYLESGSVSCDVMSNV